MNDQNLFNNDEYLSFVVTIAFTCIYVISSLLLHDRFLASEQLDADLQNLLAKVEVGGDCGGYENHTMDESEEVSCKKICPLNIRPNS